MPGSYSHVLYPSQNTYPKNIYTGLVREGEGRRREAWREGGRVLDLLENRFLQKSFRLTEKERYTKLARTSRCPSTHPASTIYRHFIIAKPLGPNYNVSLREGGHVLSWWVDTHSRAKNCTTALLGDSYRSLPLPLLSSKGQATQQILPHQFQILALTIEEARSPLSFRDSKLSATKP